MATLGDLIWWEAERQVRRQRRLQELAIIALSDRMWRALPARLIFQYTPKGWSWVGYAFDRTVTIAAISALSMSVCILFFRENFFQKISTSRSRGGVIGSRKFRAGDRFGRLVAVSMVGRDKWNNHICLFQCDCGNQTRTTTHCGQS